MSDNKAKEPSPKLLNSLLEHFQQGRNKDAEELAILITQEFPDHYFGWKVLGSLLKSKGDLNMALDIQKKTVALNSLDSESHNNLGNTFLALNRLSDAKECYKKAININPDNHIFYNNLGYVHERLINFDDAKISYMKALELNPDYSLAHRNLGSTLMALGRLQDAEESYRKCIALEPENPSYYTSLGLVLRELGKFEEAEKNYRKSLALDPKDKIAHYNLGIVLFEFRQYKEAAKHFKLTDIAHSKSFILKCSYIEDNQSTFYEELDNAISKGEINAVIGSLGCRSEIRYGIKKHNPFCNEPLKYILKTDLKKYYDFENIFINGADNILNDDSLSPKSTSLVTNGYQTTGNLFDRKDEEIIKIESIIHSEIDRYRAYFSDSEEGIISRWPSHYSLHGWLISMRSGGELASHMHDNGWLSGSVYINVPPKINTDSGNLVVSVDDGKFGIKIDKNQIKSIDVVTGSMCLFPSSLLHHTVPFESKKEERIVLAFDIIPS